MICISVIVPMYNVEEYIGNCIRQLLKQDIDKEIILIDDGSTDRTLEIAQEFVDRYPNIKLVRQDHSGQSAARNKGLFTARGEYIFFCDSDDYVEEQSLKELYKICKAHDLDILKTGWKTKCDDSVIVNTPPHQFGFTDAVLTTSDMLKKSVSRWYNVIPWNGVYRKSFLSDHNITFPEGIQFEDNTFALHTMIADPNARIMQIDFPFYIVNVRSGSTTTSKPLPKKIYDQLKNIELMNDLIDEYHLQGSTYNAAKKTVSSLTFTMTSYYYRIDKSFRKEVSLVIPHHVLASAIKYPQTLFQKMKLIIFTYSRRLLDCFEDYIKS